MLWYNIGRVQRSAAQKKWGYRNMKLCIQHSKYKSVLTICCEILLGESAAQEKWGYRNTMHYQHLCSRNVLLGNWKAPKSKKSVDTEYMWNDIFVFRWNWLIHLFVCFTMCLLLVAWLRLWIKKQQPWCAMLTFCLACVFQPVDNPRDVCYGIMIHE